MMIIAAIAAMLAFILSLTVIGASIPALKRLVNEGCRSVEIVGFALLFSALVILLVIVFPDLPVRPGSDYANATINLSKKAFLIFLSPGLGVLMSFVWHKKIRRPV